MIKLTVLFGHPKDPAAFERYYTDRHLPIAARMPGVQKLELTKFRRNVDGSNPIYYRMAEVYFLSETALQSTLKSPEGQAAAGDMANFATGGANMLVGSVDLR
jgi:uncharacterized protein (TIGR02118 family)